MIRFLLILPFMFFTTHAAAACRAETFEGVRMEVCEAHPERDDIRLFLNDGDGVAFRTFTRVQNALRADGKSLSFGFNAGMYHRDLSPVGLYIEEGEELQRVSQRDGYGNFHLLPNGIFWLGDGVAGVEETSAYLAAERSPRFASQSGPMLVIDGTLHPRFIVGSDSLKTRNGVGVREDGTVVFAISRQTLNFESFARYFRDVLQTPNALYLDGTISSAYIPDLRRHDFLFPMGPIVGVVTKE